MINVEIREHWTMTPEEMKEIKNAGLLIQHDLDDLEIIDKLYETYGDYYTCDVSSLAFFCAMVRSQIFEEIGVLDEDFEEGYSDDVDFSIRTKSAGYKLAFVPTVYIHHHNRTTFLTVYSNEEISKKLHANRTKLRYKHRTKVNNG